MTEDNDRPTDTNKTPKASHAGDKLQAAMRVKASGTADVPAGEGEEKDYWGTITITPPSETMYLYKWYPLTVSCDHSFPWGVFMNTGSETPLPADDKPGHIFLFDRPYASLNNGSGTINIMAVGPNTGTKVTVYGRSLDASIPGKADLEFVASDSPPPSIFALFALNGQAWRLPQDNELPYLVGAVYMDKDGKPLTGNIQWTVSNDSNATTTPLSPKTPLRANGTSSNGVTVVAGGSMCGTVSWFGVTVTASVDNTSLTATLPEYAVFYTAEPNILLTVDAAHTTLTATCPQFQEGAEVIWEAYPPDKVQLQYRRTKVTNGSATNTIVTAGDAQFTAYFAASTMDTTGQTDHNYLRDYGVLQFQLTPQSVVGIEIDKASCLSTWGVDIDDDTQVIRCQAKLLNAGGKQTVMLPTTPPDAGVQMWDATTGEPLSMTNQVYTMETDADGVATFLIGSANNTYFSVNVQWKKFVSPTAQLAIVSGTGPLPPPTIVPAVRGGVLTIPSDAPFFQVTIPTSRGVLKGDPVALVLNNRVVWEGTVDPAVPIDVGYAALDLTGPNTLIYVTTGLQESGPASGAAFKTSGTPLTGPFGTGDRGLDMPTVVTKVTNAVGASDIMGQGLKIQVPRYADPAVGDVITVYCYLTKGTDVLSGDPWGNIVAVTYPVLKGDPLLTGAEQVLVPLPQWAIAGYANGDLQVDYKVVTSNGTSWSKIAPSATTYFDVNTTFG
ncbi:hypothetical protein M1D80_00560 (plasmid) [Phyllobacteriaceae bacterium JZ32]